MDKAKIATAAEKNTLIKEMQAQRITFAQLFEVIDPRGFSPVHLMTENSFLPQFLQQLDDHNIPAGKEWFLVNFPSSYGGNLGRTILHLAAEKSQVPELMEWLGKNNQPLVLEDLTVTSNAGAPLLGVLTGYGDLPKIMSAFYKMGTPVTFEMLKTVETAYGQSMIEFALSRGVLSPILEELHREGQNVKFADIEPFLEKGDAFKYPGEFNLLNSLAFWSKPKAQRVNRERERADKALGDFYDKKFEASQKHPNSPSIPEK